MKRTKIVCTVGPGTDKFGILEDMMRAGMNVARFNFSHGSHEEQAERMQMVRDAAMIVNKPIALLLDTKGPEVRLGLFKEGKVFLEEGHEEELRAVLNEETAPTVLGAFRSALAELDEITPDVVKATIKAVMKETALKGKFVFMPIRVALTGQMHGPDLNNIVTLLGKEKCLHRLDNVSALTK